MDQSRSRTAKGEPCCWQDEGAVLYFKTTELAGLPTVDGMRVEQFRHGQDGKDKSQLTAGALGLVQVSPKLIDGALE